MSNRGCGVVTGRLSPMAIADQLTHREVKLNIGGSVYDPTDPIGKLLFTVLSMIAEFSVISTRRGSDLHKARAAI